MSAAAKTRGIPPTHIYDHLAILRLKLSDLGAEFRSVKSDGDLSRCAERLGTQLGEDSGGSLLIAIDSRTFSQRKSLGDADIYRQSSLADSPLDVAQSFIDDSRLICAERGAFVHVERPCVD